jgi:hypothetical protein
MVGTGSGVAVPVGKGGASGVYVAEGALVAPTEIGMGKPLQAVKTEAIRSPKRTRRWFIGVLILVKWRGVNGQGVVKIEAPNFLRSVKLGACYSTTIAVYAMDFSGGCFL